MYAQYTQVGTLRTHTHTESDTHVCTQKHTRGDNLPFIDLPGGLAKKLRKGQFEGYPLPPPARTYMAINMKFIYDYYITFRRAPKTMRICAVPAVTMIAIRIVTNWLKGMWGLSNNDLYLRNGNCADTKTLTHTYTSHTPALFVGCNAIVCCTAHVLFSIYNI